jgi:parallel beta-helix repeat protein
MTFQGRWYQNHRVLASRSIAVTISLFSLTSYTTAAALAAQPMGNPITQPQASRLSSGTIAQVSTSILYVNPALGQDSATAGKTEATPFKTITYALQQAEPGTLIQLASGSYTEQSGEVFPLILRPGVTLRGDEPNKGTTTTIIGGGAINTLSFARQNITIVAATDSVIRGVNVTNILSRGTGIWVESTNPTIANCTFSGSKREGIFLAGTANPLIEGNVFLKNDGNGISITKASQGVIRGNLFQETGFGIAIGGTSTPLIEKNQVLSNTDGIYINDSAQPILRGNVISNNKRDGIVITTSGKPNIGTTDSNGNNILKNNGDKAINNVGSQEISAVGNDLDVKKIYGNVTVTAKAIENPTPIDTGNGGTPPGGGIVDPIKPSFADIKGHWAEGFIAQLAAKGVISGFEDKTFRPEDKVTRAQFAAIILKAFTPAAKRAAVNFGDVPKTFWGFDAIQSASRGGFMAGYPGNIFQPAQPIPRVQVLVALANGLEFGEGNTSLLSKYTDGSAIPAYATGFVASSTQRKVVVNYPSLTNLNPNREATRAEVAAIVYQALVNAGKAQPIPSLYIVTP